MSCLRSASPCINQAEEDVVGQRGIAAGNEPSRPVTFKFRGAGSLGNDGAARGIVRRFHGVRLPVGAQVSFPVDGRDSSRLESPYSANTCL